MTYPTFNGLLLIHKIMKTLKQYVFCCTSPQLQPQRNYIDKINKRQTTLSWIQLLYIYALTKAKS